MNCLQCVQRTVRPCGVSNESWKGVRGRIMGDLSCYRVKVMVPPLPPGESLLKDLKPASNMAWLMFFKKKNKTHTHTQHFGEVIEDLCGLEEERPKATRPIRKQLWQFRWERNAWTKVVVTAIRKKCLWGIMWKKSGRRFMRGQEGGDSGDINLEIQR